MALLPWAPQAMTGAVLAGMAGGPVRRSPPHEGGPVRRSPPDEGG